MDGNTIGAQRNDFSIAIPEQTSSTADRSHPLMKRVRSGLSSLNGELAKNKKHIAATATIVVAAAGAGGLGSGIMRAGMKQSTVIDSSFFRNVFTTKDLTASLSMGLGTIGLIGGIYMLRKVISYAPQPEESISLEQLPRSSAETLPLYSPENHSEALPPYSSEHQTDNYITPPPPARIRN